MVNLKFSIPKNNAVLTLQLLAEGMADLSPAYGAIGQALLVSHADRFARSESPDGVKWLPNAPKTIIAYANHKFKHSTIHTAALAKRVLVWDDILLRTVHYEVTNQYLRFGTSAPTAKYGAKQQFGYKHIPARPYLGISATDVVEIRNILSFYIRQGSLSFRSKQGNFGF